LTEDCWFPAGDSRNAVFLQKGEDGTLTFLWDDWVQESMNSESVRDRVLQRLMKLRPGLVSANSSALVYGFKLVGVPGDNAYHVLADSNGNTSFELTAENFVALWGTWTPSFASIQVRLEPEDGSSVTEATLAVNDVSTVTIPTTGHYQIKVATGPDELDSGTLVLFDAPAGTIRAVGPNAIWTWGAELTLTRADGTVWAWGSGNPNDSDQGR
ncbi:MAG: hypothetical protein K2F83_06370, partial [Oscillospiraceae bacterium]|nr:hypothetical protein [Oscillospiraceae bacterium]